MNHLSKRNNFIPPILISLILCFTSCNNENSQILLAGFESKEDLNGLVWECGRWFDVTKSHSTQGEYALKVEVAPVAGIIPKGKPLFRIFPNKTDWSKYRSFKFEVFNWENYEIPLFINFIDNDSNIDPKRFYTKRMFIVSGPSKIEIPLYEIKKGPASRDLNLSKMRKVAFFIEYHSRQYSLSFDNIKLTK